MVVRAVDLSSAPGPRDLVSSCIASVGSDWSLKVHGPFFAHRLVLASPRIVEMRFELQSASLTVEPISFVAKHVTTKAVRIRRQDRHPFCDACFVGRMVSQESRSCGCR